MRRHLAVTAPVIALLLGSSLATAAVVLASPQFVNISIQIRPPNDPGHQYIAHTSLVSGQYPFLPISFSAYVETCSDWGVELVNEFTVSSGEHLSGTVVAYTCNAAYSGSGTGVCQVLACSSGACRLQSEITTTGSTSVTISPLTIETIVGIKIIVYASGGFFANCERGWGRAAITAIVIPSGYTNTNFFFRPIASLISATDTSQVHALYTIDEYTSAIVYVPASGIVQEVTNSTVVISSSDLGLYRLRNVQASAALAGMRVDGGCALGYASEPAVWVETVERFEPNLAFWLQATPSGGPCAGGWQCYDKILKHETLSVITLQLPARLYPQPSYSLDFQSPGYDSGALMLETSQPRGETYLNMRIVDRGTNNQVWGGIVQIPYPDRMQYIISPVTFVDNNRLWWTLNPVGAVNLHRVCVQSLTGGRLRGICPSPQEDEWYLGEKASWSSGNALLEDGGWIWKEMTIILPPSPQSVAPSGIQGIGAGEVQPTAISGRYNVRVGARAVSGAPELLLEKELAPGVWKELGRASVGSEAAYIPYTVQFDTGQQFLTLRLRAAGSSVEISEVCAEEEEREAELIAPCFGIEPYNPSDPGCNLLECPGLQVRYQMQKLHDVALMPPLCRIAYWVNYLYYYALNTVGKPILMYLTTIIELIRGKGFFGGIAEAIRIILESLWVSVIKPYGTQIVRWVWGAIQPVLDFIGVSEYTLKLLQSFFSLLFRLFSKAFQVLANGTIGLVRAAWLGFRNALSSPPTTPPIPPQEIQAGFELVGYSVGNILIIPLAVIFTGLLMWQFFFWSLRILGIVK